MASSSATNVEMTVDGVASAAADDTLHDIQELKAKLLTMKEMVSPSKAVGASEGSVTNGKARGRPLAAPAFENDSSSLINDDEAIRVLHDVAHTIDHCTAISASTNTLLGAAGGGGGDGVGTEHGVSATPSIIDGDCASPGREDVIDSLRRELYELHEEHQRVKSDIKKYQSDLEKEKMWSSALQEKNESLREQNEKATAQICSIQQRLEDASSSSHDQPTLQSDNSPTSEKRSIPSKDTTLGSPLGDTMTSGSKTHEHSDSTLMDDGIGVPLTFVGGAFFIGMVVGGALVYALVGGKR